MIANRGKIAIMHLANVTMRDVAYADKQQCAIDLQIASPGITQLHVSASSKAKSSTCSLRIEEMPGLCKLLFLSRCLCCKHILLTFHLQIFDSCKLIWSKVPSKIVADCGSEWISKLSYMQSRFFVYCSSVISWFKSSSLLRLV